MSRSPRLTATALSCVLPDGRALFTELDVILTAERIGLVGPTGAGRSTLLAILAGWRAPASGTVRHHARVAAFSQEARVQWPAHATVADALGIAETRAAIARIEAGSLDSRDHDRAAGRWDVDRRADQLLTALGLANLCPDRPLATLSGGEAARQLAHARREVRAPLAFAIPSAPRPAHAPLVRVDAASVRCGDTELLAPLTLTVYGDTRLAITGANGSGKSTLLGLLAGTRVATAGRVAHGLSRRDIALLTQDAWRVDASGRTHDVLAQAHPALSRTARHAWLAAFGFRGQAADCPVATLSGGERLRLALAAAIAPHAPPALLLLDEPTNHLDLDAMAALEQALRTYTGALVVVSHDAAFLDAIGLSARLTLSRPTRR